MRKKEIIIIILIIITTIILAVLPNVINKNKIEKKEETKKENYILITIEGEITKSDLVLKVPNGTSYGFILTKIDSYLNQYSITEENLTKRYYEDTTIVIESLDIGAYDTNIKEDNALKICLSTASIDELMTLYGIGEKRAKSLIEYRQRHKLESFEEIKILLGVSNEVIEAIKEKAFL